MPMKYKWKKQRLNIKLLSLLAKEEQKRKREWGQGSDRVACFNLEDAYRIYEANCLRCHCKTNAYVLETNPNHVCMDNWAKMNVRNVVAAAAYRGVLHRLEPGVYMFWDISAWQYLRSFGTSGSRSDVPVTHEEWLNGKQNRNTEMD